MKLLQHFEWEEDQNFKKPEGAILQVTAVTLSNIFFCDEHKKELLLDNFNNSHTKSHFPNRINGIERAIEKYLTDIK